MNSPTLFDDFDIPVIHSTFGVDAPRVRRTDPETSSRAADTNDVRGSRAVVLAAFYEFGAMADHQLVKRLEHSPFTPQRLRTARAELTSNGALDYAGYTTPTDTGRSARVFTLRKDTA